MKQFIVIFLLISIIAFAQQCQSIPLTAAEQTKIVADHNYFRGLLLQGKVSGQPLVANTTTRKMQVMVWNIELAALAQSWADLCKFEHRPISELKAGKYVVVGENLWATTVSTAFNVSAPTASWFSENVDYNYATNACATGKTCGHYTQVAWAESNNVGCGRGTCAGTWKTIIVCNYGPAGNWAELKPYIAAP